MKYKFEPLEEIADKEKENADMHVFVHNAGRSSLTQYLWSKHIKACGGSFV